MGEDDIDELLSANDGLKILGNMPRSKIPNTTIRSDITSNNKIPNTAIKFSTINSGFANFLKQNGITSEQLTNFNKAEIAGLYDSYLNSGSKEALNQSRINLNKEYAGLLKSQKQNIKFGNYMAVANLGLGVLGLLDARKFNRKQLDIAERNTALSEKKYNDLQKWRKEYGKAWA